MVKLFNSIRKKMLKEGKTTNYIKYAIGEIFLVVIGILIALQVNNWNEKQKTKSSEQFILKSLLKEFQYNQKLLDKPIILNKKNIFNAQTMGKYTGPKIGTVDEKKISQLMVGTFKYNAQYLPSLGTLLDLINSGNLSIISNQELRSELAAFDSELDNIHSQENDTKAEQNRAHNYFIREGNFRRHLNVIDESLIKATPSRFPKNDFKFFENHEFENHLYYYIVMASNLDKNFYAPLKVKQDSIISLIQSEIRKYYGKTL